MRSMGHWLRNLPSSGSSVAVAVSALVEGHLDEKEGKHGNHHDDSGGGGVDFGEERWETWIRERTEGCGEEMDECCCDQDTCAEMFTKEKDCGRNLEPWELFGGDGEGDTW